MPLTLLSSPTATAAVTAMRDLKLPLENFRAHCTTLSAELATSIAPSLSPRVSLIPILRAGLGMLPAALTIFPTATIGYLGLVRDERTARAREYYRKLPTLTGRDVVILDPMLATGGSALAALHTIAFQHPASITFLCVVAAPEGVTALSKDFPTLAIHAAVLDEKLDENHYIVPGMGDFGDRLNGTQK